MTQSFCCVGSLGVFITPGTYHIFTCIRLGYKKMAITPMFDNEMTWNSKLKLFCTLVNHFWGFGNSLSKFFWETCLGCTISLGESIGAICARTKPYLFSYMYALCTVYAKDIFNLCLGTFAPLTLPSKTAYMFRMHNFPRQVNRRSLCTKKNLTFFLTCMPCVLFMLKIIFNLCLATFAPLTF